MKTIIYYFTLTGLSFATAQKLCRACLHFCPKEAIQLNILPGTTNQGRYRHLDLTVEKMAKQQAELAGDREYAGSVRFRLAPGVW